MIEQNYLTEHGANVIASRVRDYWQQRGYLPNVRVERCYSSQSKSDNDRGYWVVRSDMIGGKPYVSYTELKERMRQEIAASGDC